MKDKENKEKSDISTLMLIKRFVVYYKPNMKLFGADMFCALILAICDLFYPMITRGMIDDYIPNKNIKLLVVWGVILLLIYLLKMALNYFVQYYGHIVGVRMQADMRRDVFNHLQTLPYTYFDNNKTGTIMSRIVNDLMDVTELAHHGPEDLFISVILFIGSFILLAGMNVWLTLIMFASMPVLIIFAMKKRIKMSEAFAQTRKEVGEVNANLENSISGIRVSKAFTNREYENNRFNASNSAFVRARVHAYKAMAEFTSGTSFITDFLYVIVLVSGGLFTYYGKISLGDLTAFLLFVSTFLNPIRKLIGFIEQFQNGMSGFKRFVEVLEEKPEPDADDAVAIDNVKGDIEFKKVTFSYDENSDILTELSLKIPQGKTVALVGPSGGGKTTMCNLIPRFYELNAGSITLDGHDITKVKRESLRRSIGIVAQDVFLFTGTIYDNIHYGNPNATREMVEEAAKRANIHDFIMSLPDGYNSEVGERGVKLSGGQKQRISIARVFLKNPPILILDEATSALDNATELLIQKSLEELCKGRTTLVVAHRLSTIKNADNIIVITEEGIKEQGNHEALMKLDGIYAGLYNSQFKHLTE